MRGLIDRLADYFLGTASDRSAERLIAAEIRPTRVLEEHRNGQRIDTGPDKIELERQLQLRGIGLLPRHVSLGASNDDFGVVELSAGADIVGPAFKQDRRLSQLVQRDDDDQIEEPPVSGTEVKDRFVGVNRPGLKKNNRRARQ